MPHINRIRLVNVNFNNAISKYDDFMMRFDGKSATYDLINSGGKSVLLLMLLQTVLPNTYLKSDRPLKNIFQGGNPRRTSHCLVEWILDDGYQYKYMLTGFCARKKQANGEEDNASEDKLEIDYYNYCYFYNNENQYDIKRIPLVTKDNNEKVYMPYDKLRQLLINMKKEDLEAKIFDSKKEYMKFISYYGLISAEWRLINEINTSENNIGNYFKTNKTSRKLIENFLIKIIDNVNMQNNEEVIEENQLADTLIDLKDNLIKFRRESDNKNEFLKVKEMYYNLKEKNNLLKEEFLKVDKIDKKAYEAFVYNKEKKEELENKIKDEVIRQEDLQNQNKLIEKVIGRLEIDKLYYKKDLVEKSLQDIENKKQKIQEKYKEEQRRKEITKAQNEYVEYVNNKEEVEKIKLQIENLNVNEDDVKKNYDLYGYNYRLVLKDKIDELENAYQEKDNHKKQKEDIRKIAKKQENDARDFWSSLKSKIETLEDEIANKKENIDILTKEITEEGNLEFLLNIKESIEKSKNNLNKNKENIKENEQKIENYEKEEFNKKIELEKVKADKNLLEQKLNISKEEVYSYETKRDSIEKLCKTFQVQTIEKLEEKLKEEINQEEKSRSLRQIEKQNKVKKLELIEKYDMIIPNEDIFAIKQKLENKCNYITTGIEELRKKDEEKRKEILDKNPIMIYSIFIDDDSFRKIKNKGLEIEIENLVPIISIEVLRNDVTCNENNIIFPMNRSIYQNINNENLEKYKEVLKKEIETLEEKLEKTRDRENTLREYLNEIHSFNEVYYKDYIALIYKNKTDIENSIKENDNLVRKINSTIENIKEELEITKKEFIKQKENDKLLTEKIVKLEELDKLQIGMKTLENSKEKLVKDCNAQKENLEEKEEAVRKIEEELEKLKNTMIEIGYLKENYEKTYKNLPEFTEKSLIKEDFESLKNHFEVYDSKMKNANQELNNLQSFLKAKEEMMNKCEMAIHENNCTLEYFASQEEKFIKIPYSILEEINHKIREMEEELKNIEDFIQKNTGEKLRLEGQINLLVDKLQKEKGETYIEQNRIKEMNLIDRETEENNMRWNLNKKQIKEINAKIGDVEKEVKKLENEYMLLENFVKENEIQEFEVKVENIVPNEVFSYKKVINERKKINSVINKLSTEFSQYINYIKDMVDGFYIKQDVLEKLEQLKIPTKLFDVEIVENGISTIIEMLEEKIRHIDEALKRLESYQENFITKCFEKAETIVRDLEKLPGLSRIKIGGKDTNIIKLDLFEYEKEEKISRMKNYIYSIVKEMEENPDGMSKEQLNESLSSKALVAQIINMDKASIKLYKIEDIQENSTYKKWEDDLGSDGQVNAIYFMFAVCIISYISMLTRKESSHKSKKVIIADNPFGATSAVFLWNVMFSILKENNVQLIAPGHNINKEIISKFEVNYVLKQKGYGTNKKSVVIDKEIRTEEDIDNMSFNVIEGDQQSIFI